MGRIIAVDYGRVRCGLAQTDDDQIIASALAVVSSDELLSYLVAYSKREALGCIVFGSPRRWSGEPSDIESEILVVIEKIKKVLPKIPIEREDERFTSSLAMGSLHEIGAKKKHKKDKGIIDKISATIILQSFLEKKI